MSGVQKVYEVSAAQAQQLAAQGKQVGPHTFAVKALGVTVTFRPGSAPGRVKVIAVKGCAC